MKFSLETVTSYQNRALTQMVRKALPKAVEGNDEPLSGDSKDFLAQLSLPAKLASQQSGVPHHLIWRRRRWNPVGGNAKSAVRTVSRALTFSA